MAQDKIFPFASFSKMCFVSLFKKDNGNKLKYNFFLFNVRWYTKFNIPKIFAFYKYEQNIIYKFK